MRQHVAWAKRAGIDGFIVSWKSTPVLNRRLERLAEVADAEHFKLLVIYQGLDFYREPLPARGSRATSTASQALRRGPGVRRVRQAARDLVRHVELLAARDRRASPSRGATTCCILASERNVDGYRRLADLVDGDAYYWASVNPRTYPGQAGEARADREDGARQRRHLDPLGGAGLRRPAGGRHERRRAPRAAPRCATSSTRPRARIRTRSA